MSSQLRRSRLGFLLTCVYGHDQTFGQRLLRLGVSLIGGFALEEEVAWMDLKNIR